MVTGSPENGGTVIVRNARALADSMKRKVQPAAGVTRVPGHGASGPLANPKFLEALCANDSVEGKRNTSAIEVGPSQLVAGRISTYSPTRTLPLQEVSDRARLLLIAEKSAELARKDAEAKKAAWTGNAAPAAGLAPAVVVSRDQTQNVPLAGVDARLRASRLRQARIGPLNRAVAQCRATPRRRRRHTESAAAAVPDGPGRTCPPYGSSCTYPESAPSRSRP